MNDEVVLLLRRGDLVGLRELLRRERREYEHAVVALVNGRRDERPDEAIAVEVHGTLLPVLERRLASLLPLAFHHPELLGDEMDGLAQLRSRQPTRPGVAFWPTLIDWCAWWLGGVLGAYLTEIGRYDGLPAIFAPRISGRHGTGSEPLVGSYVAQPADGLGRAVMKHVTGERCDAAPAWESRRRDVAGLALVRERYSELMAGGDQPLRAFVEFDFIHNIALGLAGERAVAHWAMYESVVDPFAARLHADARLRERLAEGLELRLDEFDEKAPDALNAAFVLGSFPDKRAIDILRSGTWR